MNYNEYYQAVKKGLSDYLLGNGIDSEEELEKYMKSQEDCIKNDFDLHINEYKAGKFSDKRLGGLYRWYSVLLIYAILRCKMSKFILHIPCKMYVDGKLVDNGYDKCVDTMVQKLAVIDVHDFYILDAKGYYKGRAYDEKLMVVFHSSDEVAEAFIQTCRELDKELGQEVYAYEKDNELITFIV